MSQTRRQIDGWSVRWDQDFAARTRQAGCWLDETIGDAARRLAQAEPDRELIVDGVRRLTAGVMLAEAERVAAAFTARGFTPGDVISFMLPNWHEACVIYLAATLVGLVAHPLVPAYREAEVGFQLADTKSKLLFMPAMFRKFDYLEMIRTVRGRNGTATEIVVVRGDSAEFTAYQALLDTTPDAGSFPRIDPDAVRMVLYTSGTTGRPKGVLHSHNSINADIVQLREHWRAGDGDCFFVPSPVSHIGGSLYTFEFPWLCKTRAVLLDTWHPEVGIDLMLKERCTHAAGATVFLQQSLAAAQAKGTRLPDLKVYICGGASVPPSLIRNATDWFANCKVTRAYGSTEVPTITIGSMAEGDIFHASETDGGVGIGEIKLVAADDSVVSGATEGEVLARAPQMLVGYLREEDEAGAFDDEGFFRMGDLARWMDDIYIVITGRKKDIIIRQGENISPKEVEDLLILHADIEEIAVIGLPDERTGERACAVIVPRAGAGPLQVADIKAYLESYQVARFKVPEQVVLRATLPKNAAGKILKHNLREEILASQARA